MCPLTSGWLEDVEVLAVVLAEPEVAGELADAGAATTLTTLGVIERLGGAVVGVHDEALDVAERVTNGVEHQLTTRSPGAAGSQAGHGAGSDEGLHLAKRVVPLAKDRKLVGRVAVVMAVDGADGAGGLAVANG